jgi:hypothetical protein
MLRIAEHATVALPPVSRLHGYDAAPQRVSDQVSLSALVQFAHEIGSVGLNRPRADEEGHGDLAVRQPPRRQIQH